MSQKNYSEDQIIDVIIKILDTRQDIKKDVSLTANLIDHTLKNKSVQRTIAALQDMPEEPEIDESTADYMLERIINLLAVITEVIDKFALSRPTVLKN
jgi:hypothetical protein